MALRPIRSAPVTLALAAVIACVFAVVWMIGGEEETKRVAQAGSLTLPHLLAGQLWRIPVSALLHGGWGHFCADSTWLLVLGLLLEPAIGSKRFSKVCLTALFVSSAVGLLFEGGLYGASGITSGLQGAILARPIRARGDGAQRIDWAWIYVAVATLWNLPFQQFSPEIAFSSHVGGLIAGVCVVGLGRPLEAGRGSRPIGWRAAAVSLAVLGLLAALAPNPRWRIDWHARLGSTAEAADDFETAERHWKVVESISDPRSEFDADRLDEAAWFWSRRDQVEHARGIESQIALAREDPKLYYRLGLMQAVSMPRQEAMALASWKKSLDLDPCQPEALVSIAEVRLAPHDSSLYSPSIARAAAWCAVTQDEMRTPAYLRDLAFAHLYRGEPHLAVRWMTLAVERNPASRDRYLTDLRNMEKAVARGGAAEARRLDEHAGPLL